MSSDAEEPWLELPAPLKSRSAEPRTVHYSWAEGEVSEDVDWNGAAAPVFAMDWPTVVIFPTPPRASLKRTHQQEEQERTGQRPV